MKSFGLVLGSSGTGKGVRMNQLLLFLLTKYDHEEYFVDYEGKNFNIGYLIPELDILFLGKYTINKKAGYSSWSSMDGLWSKFGGTEPTVAFIKTLPHNIIAEGYANMDTFRVRPKHMSSEGCKKFFYQTYVYGKDNFDAYIDRIIGRSGEKPKGTTAFDKESQILKWRDKIESDLNEIECEDMHNGQYRFDEDITTLGFIYLTFLDHEDLANEFVEYSKEFQAYKEFKKVNTLF